MVGEEHPREVRIRTLVVDDSPASLRAICSFVEKYQWIELVGSASDGCDAWELIRRVAPDLVLMDLQMPRMNGLELASRVASEFPHIQVIMVTLFDTPHLRAASRESGAGWFIPKERLRKELPTALSELCASRLLAREAAEPNPSQ